MAVLTGTPAMERAASAITRIIDGLIEPDQLALMRRLVMVAALNTGDPDTYLGDLPELVWAISWRS
jgi:hypothetical protein